MSGYHARLSPSGAARWMNCPGSVAAEVGYEDDTSIYAAEGTVAHHVAAECLQDERKPGEFFGDTIHADGFDIEVDRDMVHYVELYIDQVREINRHADATFVEVRAPIGHVTGEDDASGTSDFVGVEFYRGDVTVVRVHDLKYGKGVLVEAEDNLQLALYALGVVHELEHLLVGGDDQVHLELYIHQPRLHHLPVWRLTLAELREIETKLRAGAKAAHETDAPRVPGEAQCRFCKHRRACPELRELIEGAVAEEPPQDAAAIAEALPKLSMIRDWAATVEARAIALLEMGMDVPGYKLVEGRRSRIWNADPDKLERALKYRTGLKKPDIYEQKLISVAQAEKRVPKEQWPRIEKLVEYRPGKPTIAPVTDKRPAVNGADAMGFEDLTAEETVQ